MKYIDYRLGSSQTEQDFLELYEKCRKAVNGSVNYKNIVD